MFGLFEPRPWALHNPLKSWTLAGLSLRECQLLVASMTDAEMKVCWAYHQKWSDWKPLTANECHALFKHKDPHFVHPALPQMVQEDDHEITQVQPSTLTKPQEPIYRKFSRYNARIAVEIVVRKNSFSTHTLDLSEGGFYFEDPLPDWVAGYFTVILKIPNEKFEFTCVLAEDQKKEKFRTEIAPTTTEEAVQYFKNWLLAQKFPETPVSK